MKESVYFSTSQYCLASFLSSSSSSSSHISFELDYQFESYGNTRLSFFVKDHMLNTTSFLPHTFTLLIESDFCSQSGSNQFQCWMNPSNVNSEYQIDSTHTSYTSTCVNSELDCFVKNRCEVTESLCWDHESFSQRCTDVAQSVTTCPCVKHRCASGQCVDTPDQ